MKINLNLNNNTDKMFWDIYLNKINLCNKFIMHSY